MVLRKGKVEGKFRFNNTGTAIPTITEEPVRNLGKVDWLGLPGKFKAWVYQHGILPRILWLLLVYVIPNLNS